MCRDRFTTLSVLLATRARTQAAFPSCRPRGPACTYHWRRRRPAARGPHSGSPVSGSGGPCSVQCSGVFGGAACPGLFEADARRPASTSVRGALGRQKLQQELSLFPGVLSRRIRQNAAQRMNPTSLVDPDFATMVRCLERYGGYGRQCTLAPLAWMVAQASDHLNRRGSTEACADLLALLQLTIDQANIEM